MGCFPKAKPAKRWRTWIIVKTTLFGINIGGCGLWSCTLLGLTVIACSKTQKWLTAGKIIFWILMIFFFFFLKMDCVYEGTSHNDDFFFPPLLLLQLTSCLPLMSVPLTLQIPCCLSRTIIHPPSCSHLSFTISASTCQVISLFVLPPLLLPWDAFNSPLRCRINAIIWDLAHERRME